MISIDVKKDECADACIEVSEDSVRITDSFITIETRQNDLFLERTALGNGCGICYELSDKQGQFRFEFTDADAFDELAKVFVVKEVNRDR